MFKQQMNSDVDKEDILDDEVDQDLSMIILCVQDEGQQGVVGEFCNLDYEMERTDIECSCKRKYQCL